MDAPPTAEDAPLYRQLKEALRRPPPAARRGPEARRALAELVAGPREESAAEPAQQPKNEAKAGKSPSPGE